MGLGNPFYRAVTLNPTHTMTKLLLTLTAALLLTGCTTHKPTQAWRVPFYFQDGRVYEDGNPNPLAWQRGTNGVVILR